MGPRDLLDDLRGAGLSVTLDCGRIIVAPKDRLTDAMRDAIRAHRGELVAVLAPPPLAPAAAQAAAPASSARIYRLTRQEADDAHAEPWGDEETRAFTARRDVFLRRGYNADDADDLAELLAARDANGDDQRMCLECSHLGERGRCLAAAAGRLPGADRRLEPVPTILQRCEAFGLRKGQP